MASTQKGTIIDPNRFLMTTLYILVPELEVLCESIVDFDNLKLNEFDLFEDIAKQKWESFFNRLKGLVYPNLIKYFWLNAKVLDLVISSFVLGNNITISKKSLAKLLSFDRSRKRYYDMSPKGVKIKEVISTIFKGDVNNPSTVKHSHQRLRIWAKIILGCIHHKKD